MGYTAIVDRLPGWLSRHILHFEAAIEVAVARFADDLPARARVLDAGAGEVSSFALLLPASATAPRQDLAIGDGAPGTTAVSTRWRT